LLSKALKNNNNIETEDDDNDCILIEDNDIKIDWDNNKKTTINNFSSFRDLMNKKIETNIFIIIDKFLKENFYDILDKLSQKEFRLAKYLYFFKKEFDEKINNNTIPKISLNISTIFFKKLVNFPFLLDYY
jgi:hypothetical protein